MVWVKGELLTDIESPALDPAGLLERAAQPNLFDRREWFRLLSRHDGGSPLIARVTSEGAIGWLFLKRNGNGRVESLSNWYSFAFRPVFAGDPDENRKSAMLVAAARRLRRARPTITEIRFAPVPTEDGSAALLARSFRRAGWLVHEEESSASWTMRATGLDFQSYWNTRPGRLRSTYKRKSSKAELEVTILDRFDEAAWESYEEVYANSWKPEEGAPALLREMAIAAGAAGTLRLGLCALDGEPMAAQFWTVENGTAMIHKLAYRTSATELSAGTVLTAEMFRYAIDRDHVDRIDFGTGDDPYKCDWMDTRTALFRVRAFNPGTFAGLAGAAKATVSRLVRRGRSS